MRKPLSLLFLAVLTVGCSEAVGNQQTPKESASPSMSLTDFHTEWCGIVHGLAPHMRHLVDDRLPQDVRDLNTLADHLSAAGFDTEAQLVQWLSAPLGKLASLGTYDKVDSGLVAYAEKLARISGDVAHAFDPVVAALGTC